jgi:hypothetical protein
MNQMTVLVHEEEISQEDWKANAERLEERVCALLAKNQALRMQLLEVGVQLVGNRYSSNLYANPSNE